MHFDSQDVSRATTHEDVTQLLMAWSEGAEGASEHLYPLVYDHLRRLARGRMRHERGHHTLQTTALVHEAYLRLAEQRAGDWESRGQFFALAARMMRRILVDHARRRGGQKRGGDVVSVSLDDAPEIAEHSPDVVAVHEALEHLAKIDPRKAQMVELRFFGGLSIEEAAESLGVSPGTVMRDWTLAKAWLKRYLRPGPPAS